MMESASGTALPQHTSEHRLLAHLPAGTDPDALLEGFLAYCDDSGLTLYEAQEEAVLEVFAGNNVILNTPTGSGKSMVALAAHFMAIARSEHSWYTAPIKALVNEKFFAACRELGAVNVGMLTGDAAVNADAPVVCATAEILANVALRSGARAAVDHVTMDEFHYYSDRDRGWAWQVPLPELPQAAFLLMSATLGDVSFFEEDLTRRNGRPTTVVRSASRPVPLSFEYREETLHESVGALMESGEVPAYLVHFTQKDATDRAQALTSMDLLSKDEKAAVRSATDRVRFDTPFGKDLKRYLHHGVGVHHAGLLPKYRLLVERLAQQGLLKVVCGTDTLGVGVNVPIRTVVFTQLCKYDGERTRVLSVRDFQQIAGRAGRKGYDDHGSVWVLAPAHVVENRRAERKAAGDAKKLRKLVKKKPPEFGYANWDAKTFDRLVAGSPEKLTSSFDVTHAMLLELLDRPGDGCAAVRRLLTDNHEPRAAQRRHIRRAIAIYRSLLAHDVLERLDEPDELGRLVRVRLDLQEDFRLNQPLSPFVLEAVRRLDRESPSYALDVVSVVESTLENPTVVLRRQLDKLKGQLLAELKAEGVEYEERMEALSQLEWPKPLAEFIYAVFDAFRTVHAWAASENVQPKSVVRDLYETSMSFNEYVGYYSLRTSEGVLLRYLSDAYKALVQTVPEDDKTDDLYDLTEWLGVFVRRVDSSLLDEWERLQHPEDADAAAAAAAVEDEGPYDVTANRRAFRIMVRNECFRLVQLLARRRYAELEQLTPEAIDAQMAPYWAEYDEIRTDAAARGPVHFRLTESGPLWPVSQTLCDPADDLEWALTAHVDLAASREEGRAVVRLDSVAPIGA